MKSVFLTLLAVLLALVAYRLLTGRIRTAGLLTGPAGAALQPDRVQSLYLTLLTAAAYVALCTRAGALVEPPLLLLAAQGGSQVLYLIGKFLHR